MALALELRAARKKSRAMRLRSADCRWMPCCGVHGVMRRWSGLVGWIGPALVWARCGIVELGENRARMSAVLEAAAARVRCTDPRRNQGLAAGESGRRPLVSDLRCGDLLALLP